MATKRSLLLLLLVGALAASACYPAYGVGVRVGFAPPPFRHEAVIVAPGPGHVWIDGYYEWSAPVANYVWVPGRWERPPRGGGVWVRPRYVRRHGYYYYHPGHWR